MHGWQRFVAVLWLAGCGEKGATFFVPDLSSADLAAPVDLAAPIVDAGADLAPSDAATPGDMSAQAQLVTFSYTPAWTGVTAVSVIGGFGTSDDWDPKSPFLTLTNDSGTWTGQVSLPPGTYDYIFSIVGDDDGTTKTSRYSIDPLVPDFVECPDGPTSGGDPNPCSVLTIPQAPPATTYHLRGQVVYDGAPESGYLVILERDEPSSHHFFANRVDSDSSGNFDFTVASGTYRVQVLHPTFLKKNDLQRVPGTLQALRRAISDPVMVSSAVTIKPAAEVAYHDYDKMTPQAVLDGGGLPLPQTFAYTIVPQATSAHAQVYGGKQGFTNIGDPWWTGDKGTATSESFDGTFNTKKADTQAVTPGQGYFWGTEEFTPKPDGGVSWTDESMVFPIIWN